MTDTSPIQGASRALAERLPELAVSVRRRLRAEVPEYAADVDPGLAVHESRRISAALRSFDQGLADRPEPDNELIREATDEARSAAQAGIELSTLIQTYRVAQAEIADAVLAEATRMLSDSEQQLAVQKRLSHFQFQWNDTVVSAVVQAYQDESRRFFFQSRDRRLRSDLRELISGRTDELPNNTYPLTATHLAAVVWGDHPKSVIDYVATKAEAGEVLSVSSTSGTTLAWFAVDDADAAQKRLRDGLEFPQGGFVALGEAGVGLAGFRSSHHQAWRAYRIGRLTSSRCTWHSDVALEAVFLHDLQAARDLVAQQLGRLDLSDPRTEVLCETMRAYFGVGCNAAQAAAQLNVHERTVAYRIRTVEGRLDIDVTKRRDELAVALRLLTVLRSIARATSPVNPVVEI